MFYNAQPPAYLMVGGFVIDGSNPNIDLIEAQRIHVARSEADVKAYQRNVFASYNGLMPTQSADPTFCVIASESGSAVRVPLVLKRSQRAEQLQLAQLTNAIAFQTKGMMVYDNKRAVAAAAGKREYFRLERKAKLFDRSTALLPDNTVLNVLLVVDGVAYMTVPPSLQHIVRTNVASDLISRMLNTAGRAVIQDTDVNALTTSNAIANLRPMAKVIEAVTEKASRLVNPADLVDIALMFNVVRGLRDETVTASEYLIGIAEDVMRLAGRAEELGLAAEPVSNYDRAVSLAGTVESLTGVSCPSQHKQVYDSLIADAFQANLKTYTVKSTGESPIIALGAALLSNRYNYAAVSGKLAVLDGSDAILTSDVTASQTLVTWLNDAGAAALREAVANGYAVLFGGDAPYFVKWAGLTSVAFKPVIEVSA